jgi:hypothetical protein
MLSQGDEWLAAFSSWLKKFLIAVAEARIPPSKMAVVPERGAINLITSILGIILYTAATQINAETRNLSLASSLTMIAIAAALLFVAAVVVLLLARPSNQIVDEWQKTASLFIIVWLLALVVFMLLTYPSLLISNNNFLDKVAYWVGDLFPSDLDPWVYDLLKSMISASLAGLILIYRTTRLDPSFSVLSLEPWLWLALVTGVVGVIFDISLYRLSTY